MITTNETKLKVLQDMGLTPHIEDNAAVAEVPYTSIAIKVLEIKKRQLFGDKIKSVKLQVVFKYKDKYTTQTDEYHVSEKGELTLMTNDGFKCIGKLRIS